MSVHQVSHELIRETLRGGLLVAMDSERGLGSVQCRASAALYVLLGEHPIDRRGRCRSCRRPGAVVRRRRRFCRVYLAARYYLYQPEEVLLCHIAGELNQDVTTPSGAGGLPEPCRATLAAPFDPEAPEVLPDGTPRTGGSTLGRGAGPGSPYPDTPRPRSTPSDNTGSPSGDRSLSVPGGVTWQM